MKLTPVTIMKEEKMSSTSQNIYLEIFSPSDENELETNNNFTNKRDLKDLEYL